MIYVSVDNDHHSRLLLDLLNKYQVASDEITFISHISPRNRILINENPPQIKVMGHPLSSGMGYRNFKTYVLSYIHYFKLRSKFAFKKDDVLIIATEYQLNNAFLAKWMSKIGGLVYLFDEGIGFYFNNSAFHHGRISLKDRWYLLLYKLAFSITLIPAYPRKGFEGRMFSCIDDRFVDGVYSRMRLPIDRPLKIFGYRNLLDDVQAEQNKDVGCVLVFGGNLTSFGVGDEERVVMRKVIEDLSRKFKKVLIKIHPGDAVSRSGNYDFFHQIIQEHENVSEVDNFITGNEAIKSYRPKIVIGALGATLFDSIFFGCQPIFLFHLLPSAPEFKVCEFFLNNLNYKFIKNIDDIGPDYSSGLDPAKLLFVESEKMPWELIKNSSFEKISEAD